MTRPAPDWAALARKTRLEAKLTLLLAVPLIVLLAIILWNLPAYIARAIEGSL